MNKVKTINLGKTMSVVLSLLLKLIKLRTYQQFGHTILNLFTS
jgi:hypothetical protein